MQTTDLLLRTKIHLPFIRPNLVPRPNLQDRIAEGLRFPLTLVIAPAGFGKTTLVAASMAGCRMPVAWLSLDRDDNQAGRFLTYLIAALHGADDLIGSEAAQLMAEMQLPPPEAVLTSLINDLDVATGEIVLVLDDYQYISNQTIHAGVAFLLEHCPLTFHLLIATRSDPPLPVARLRARGQMVELRAADLRFTAPEAAQFLNDVMGLQIDDGSVALLEERTEGWIAGLQMAALSMRDREDVRGFIEGFSGTHRHILDYLLEEILAGQSPEVQRFLLNTSILERLTAPLCDAILKDEDGRMKDEVEKPSIIPVKDPPSAILEYLERENLFLISLDDERIWFRYHHLFADLLKARLHQVQPALIPRLHVRASAWLEENGFIPEAIQHLFAAQEINCAADLIEQYAPVRLAEGDPSVLQMADSLPQEMILARPIIGLYQAWLLIIHSRIGKAHPLLIDLARQLAGVEPKSGQRWMQAVIAVALAFLAPPASPADMNPLPDYRLLEDIPPEEPILRNAADYLYGMALARRGDFDRAVEVSVKNIQREKTPHGTLAIPTLAPFLTRLYLMQGRLRAVASLCREFLDPIKERGIRFIYTSGSMKIDLGEVYYEQNCLEEAEQYFRDGLQANKPWRNIMTDGFGLRALTRVLQAKRDYAGAMQAIEMFSKRMDEHSQPREFDEDLRTLRVRVHLASGDLQSAVDWADQVQLSEDFHHYPEYYRLTLARIRLAQGRYADVEKILTSLPSLPGSGNRIARQIEANLLLAAAIAGYGGQQRLPETFGLIESSLALAEPEGYVRVFLNEGQPMQMLLAQWLAHASAGPLRDYAFRLLSQFGTEPQTIPAARDKPSPTGNLVEPLSQRELEVLHLIALGKTNPEIARQLIVSTGTVKAHTASIYRKLDVANRTEAVARARQLCLLP